MSATVSIVAVATRYADVDGPDQLWDTVVHQRTAFRRLPDTRLPLSEYLDGPDNTMHSP